MYNKFKHKISSDENMSSILFLLILKRFQSRTQYLQVLKYI